MGENDAVTLWPDEQELRRPPPLLRRLHMMARFVSVFVAAVPTTTVPPILLTVLLYRRFRNETLFQRIHKVFAWARFSARRILQMDIRIQGRKRLPGDRSG